MKHTRDESRTLHVPNLSANSFPILTLQRKIGGTIYTVTCSFDGKEQLRDKYQRIILQKISQKEDNET